MKYLFPILSFTLLFTSNLQADNGLNDLTAQLNAFTESAFKETSQQMAVKVNLSGKQRMLTQKMSKEALLIALSINPKSNLENISNSAKLFEKTLKGLQKSDDSLGLTKTTDQSILQQLDKVAQLWENFKIDIEGIIKKGTNPANLKNISDKNLQLLSEMNKAVGLYEKNSGADINDLALVVNLSGKQRMLTQKMTKEYLMIIKGINPDKNKKNLEKTITLFDKTLKGLIKGDKSLQLPATTDKKILAQLSDIKTYWKKFKPLIETISNKKKNLKKLETMNLELLKKMNQAVKMYEQQAAG